MPGLEFPFPYRPGQREMVSAVYRSILRRKQLFVQAPTGVGKTMSTVFPAVRACGEGLGSRIFYLTAKTITRTVAEEAFSVLKDRGLAFKVLTITAKEKMCLLEEPDCNPAACPRARGHYDRINEAVFEILTGQSRYQREDILAQSEKWQVCPYELELELASWMDAIICDYNYVFDPDVKLRRFFGEGSRKEDFIFLIDEAHNLVERGREMYSAEVCKEDFLDLKKKVRPFSRKLERALERCNHQLLLYKRECEGIRRFESAGTFAMLAAGLLGELEDFLQELEEGALRKEALEFYFGLRAFVSVYDLVDSNYMIYGRHREDGCFCLKLCCVNPAGNLQNCLDKGRGAVFFSATLLPVTYYRKLLSGRGEEDYAVYIPSPFDPEKRRLLIGRDVSSRYKRRGAGGVPADRRIHPCGRGGQTGKLHGLFPFVSYAGRGIWDLPGSVRRERLPLPDAFHAGGGERRIPAGFPGRQGGEPHRFLRDGRDLFRRHRPFRRKTHRRPGGGYRPAPDQR